MDMRSKRKERYRSKRMQEANYIRGINREIFRELTQSGKLKNMAGIVGAVKELNAVKDICGLPFEGYLGKIETIRPSGVRDEVNIAFEWEVPYRRYGIEEFDVIQEFALGSRIMLTGKIQTLKDYGTGRRLVYVLADFITKAEGAPIQNDIAVTGEIVYKPRYRETPRGRHITDIFVKVQKELAPGSCYIPCVCWEDQADTVAGWKEGDRVSLLARYQSREYMKTVRSADGTTMRERRKAYELSVQMIVRTGGSEDMRVLRKF